jgi:hypothetical protein
MTNLLLTTDEEDAASGTSIQPRTVTAEPHEHKVVTFFPDVRVYQYVDQGYNRCSVLPAQLSAEDIRIIIRLRHIMMKNQYISDLPLLSEKHFVDESISLLATPVIKRHV